MAVKLEIEVRQTGTASGGSGGAGGSASFSPADATAVKSALETASRLEGQLAKQAADLRKDLTAAGQGLQQGLAAAVTASDRNASRLGLSIQRSLETAAKDGGKTVEREVEKGIGDGSARGLARMNRNVTAATAGTLPAFARFGSDASAAFGTAFGGNLLSGNLLRGAGGLAGATTRLGGDLGNGLAKAVGGAFDIVPFLGPALGGAARLLGSAFSVAGQIGGVVVSAAGEIAGAFGDALATGLKISVAAAVGVGVLGVRQAIREADVSGEFEKIAKASGDTFASGLQKLRAATKDTISDFELMRLANLANREGIADTVDEFGRLAETARLLGKGVNQEAVPAIEHMVRGLGQLSGRSLAALGVTLDEKQIFDKLAVSLGTTSDKLNENQKKHALLAAAMQESAARIKDTGADVTDASDRLDHFGASAANTSGTIGRLLLPGFETLLKGIDPVVTALDRFIERESSGAGGALADNVAKANKPLSELAAFIDRLKSEDVFKLARDASEELWIRFRAAADAAMEFARLKGIAAFKDIKASAIEAITPGFAADDSNLRTWAKTARDEASAARASASGLSFSPSGADAERVAAIVRGREAQIADINGRQPLGADSRPTSRPSDGADSRPAGGGLLSSASGFRSLTSINQRALGIAARVGSVNDYRSALTDAVDPRQLARVKPVIDALANSLLELDDPTKQIEQAVKALDRSRLAEEVDKLSDDVVKPLERAERNWADTSSEYEKIREQAIRDRIDAEKKSSELAKDLAKGVDEIRANLFKKEDAILAERDRKVDGVNQQVTGRRDELIGLAGGLGADETSIPGKLRRAAAKVRRSANKERRDSLRNLTDGATSDELAANGGELLRSVFTTQAKKETGSDQQIAQIVAEAQREIVQAEQEASKATHELVDAINAGQKEQAAILKDTGETILAATKEIESSRKELDAVKKDLEDAKRALASIRRGG